MNSKRNILCVCMLVLLFLTACSGKQNTADSNGIKCRNDNYTMSVDNKSGELSLSKDGDLCCVSIVNSKGYLHLLSQGDTTYVSTTYSGYKPTIVKTESTVCTELFESALVDVSPVLDKFKLIKDNKYVATFKASKGMQLLPDKDTLVTEVEYDNETYTSKITEVKAYIEVDSDNYVNDISIPEFETHLKVSELKAMPLTLEDIPKDIESVTEDELKSVLMAFLQTLAG